jgi:murein L,D-transpeptidase YcbB/YkuD
MRTRPLIHFLPAIAVALSVGVAALAGPVEDEIAANVQAISDGQVTAIGGVALTGAPFIAELYALRENVPLWAQTRTRDDLARELADAERHGFLEQDFSVQALSALLDQALSDDPAAVARFDIAATEIAARLLHHVYYGKVDPRSLDADWSFVRPYAPGNPASLVNQYLEVATLGALIDDIEIRHPAYLRLQDALAQYIALAERGGWPLVPEGATLKPMMQDPRVPVLRQRLSVSGDFTGPAGEGDIYDDDLVAAVQRFQSRHGLNADGAVGPKTFAALNRSVEQRIDQLRASLERARWLFRDLGRDYVFVNIGGPETYLVQDGVTVWRTRSIVGRAYRQTPVFRGDIRYMEFNPTWTVPYSIFRDDKLAIIRRDPGYLARGGFTVLDADGQPISPDAVDWSGIPRVTLRQEPGPGNALGRVKFMFPNAHSVYLHDTDNHSLFDRNERNFSSGCVRIENPFELADLLMKDDPDWSAARREAILATGRTTRVNLPAPVPVLLTYFTAWMGDDGTMQFRDDVYDRDEPLLSALRAEFSG